MMKLTIVLFVAALAYTSAKAFDDDQDLSGLSDLTADDLSSLSDFSNIDIPSPEDIKKIAPSQPGEHVQVHYSSTSSETQLVNGKLKNKQKSKSIDNIDGDVKETSYEN